MRCEVCGEESPVDFVSCPNCQAWNSEIDRIGVRIYYLAGIGVALLLLSLSSVLPIVMRMALVLACSGTIAVAAFTAAGLRKLQKGKRP